MKLFIYLDMKIRLTHMNVLSLMTNLKTCILKYVASAIYLMEMKFDFLCFIQF